MAMTTTRAKGCWRLTLERGSSPHKSCFLPLACFPARGKREILMGLLDFASWARLSRLRRRITSTSTVAVVSSTPARGRVRVYFE